MLQFGLENELIERQVMIENGVPVRSILRNKKSGAEWSTDGKEPVIALPGIDLKGSCVSGETAAKEGEKSLIISFQTADYEVRWEWKLWEDLAVIESRIGVKRTGCRRMPEEKRGMSEEQKVLPEPESIDSCGCDSRHVKLTAIQFYDCSDDTDMLVEKREFPLYSRGSARYDGHVFILQETVSGEELLWVKNAPCEVAQFHRDGSDMVKHSLQNIHLCGRGLSI